MKINSSYLLAGTKRRNTYTRLRVATYGSILAAFFFCSCENDARTIKELSERVIMKEEAVDVESMLSQEGKLRAKLKAPLMLRVFADTMYTEFPKTLHCDFYDSTANIETWLDSQKGKYFENLNKVYLWDSVVVISRTGDTLKCKDLWWDQSRKIFYSDNYAEYLTLDKKIYPGKGLVATQDFSSIIFNYPTGLLQVKESGFPQ